MGASARFGVALCDNGHKVPGKKGRPMYFDDFTPGFQFETESASLSESEIIEFAKLYDPQPFHIDPVAAAASAYGGIIASGFQTMLLAFRLTLQAGIWNEASMGSPGMREVAWTKPVRPGDRLFVRAQVTSMRASKTKPDRGMVEFAYAVINQDGDTVMRYEATHMLKRRG